MNCLSTVLTEALSNAVKTCNTNVTPEEFIEALKVSSVAVMVDLFNRDEANKLQSVYDFPTSPSGNVLAEDKPKKIVRGYIDGCFDIMHSGHYNALRQAKSLCDVLVVGVHSDAEIMRNKGPPVMHETERLAAAKACKWADEVVFDTPYDPSIELLDKLNCDFGVHGDDMPNNPDGTVGTSFIAWYLSVLSDYHLFIWSSHSLSLQPVAYADLREANRLRIIKRTEGVSTTDLVGRLLLMTKQHLPSIEAPVKPVISTSLAQDPSVSAQQEAMVPVTRQTRAQSSTEDSHYAEGLTGFLPTTWRIVQFSNMRKPQPEDKIVYIDGDFDLFHVGHVETLRKAKELGSFLYVGVFNDNTVNKYKGKNYPIMNLHERVLNVLSCKYVDEVVIGAPHVITKDLLTVLNVATVTSANNTRLFDIDCPENKAKVDPYSLPKSLNIYTELPSGDSLDTTDVIQRIIDNRLKYEERNKSRSTKELNYLETRQTMEEH